MNFYHSYNTGYVKITTNCEVKGGVTLLLPYGSGSGDRNTSGKATIHRGSGNNYYSGSILGIIYDNGVATFTRNTLVKIANGVKLTIEANATLEIAGELTGSAGGNKAGHTAGKYAELQLEGTASVEVSGTANITGFVNNADGNNSGSMTVYGGGKLYQPFTLIDYKGGSLLAATFYGIQAGKAYSPFSQFVMQNVTTKLRMNYGSSMEAYCNLVASKTHNFTTAKVIGSGGIIELTNGSYSYLESKYDPATGKVKLDIYGGAKTNAMSLTVLENEINSKDFVFGISWIYDITLAPASGQTDVALFNMINRNKLLPGARLVVQPGAQLTVDQLCIYESSMESDVGVEGSQPFIDAIHAGKYPLNLPAAEFIVRGTVIANVLAGNVKTDVDNAMVQVTGSTTMTTYEPTVMTGENTSAQITEDKAYTWNLVLIYVERVSDIKIGKDYTSKNEPWITVETADFTVPNYYDVQWTVDGVTYTTVGKTGTDRNVSIPVGAGVTVTIIPKEGYMYFPNAITSFSLSEWQAVKSNNKWTPTTSSTPAVYYVPSFSLDNRVTDDDGTWAITINYCDLGLVDDQGNSRAYVSVILSITNTIYDGGKLSITVQNATATFTSNGGSSSNESNGTYEVTGNSTDGTLVTITATIRVDGNMSSSIVLDASYTKGSTGGGCFTPDTLITLADGTQKRIDELTYNDQILVWNFNTGKYDVRYPSAIINHGESLYRVVSLEFSDGTIVRIIDQHGFFDTDQNKFVFISEENVQNYLGHRFTKLGEERCESVELVAYTVSEEITYAYSVLTYECENSFAAGMLSITPFPGVDNEAFYGCLVIGENMTYDQDAIQELIEKHGLYTFEELEAYGVSYEQYKGANLGFLKVIVGEGIVTLEEALRILSEFVPK